MLRTCPVVLNSYIISVPCEASDMTNDCGNVVKVM